LQLAADSLIKNIRFTQSLALKDDKYQPVPINNSSVEMNRSKYWFKQWWHIKITNAGNDIIYYIFSDSPRAISSANFNKKIVRKVEYTVELAKNAYGKYLIGANKEDSGNNNYPSKNSIDKTLNLTKEYGIKRIEFNGYSSSSMPNKMGKRIDVLFDSFGNVFLNEGKYGKCPSSYTGDCGDINPLDEKNRKLLTKNINIKLCLDNPCIKKENRCVQINISPTGFVYKSDCN